MLFWETFPHLPITHIKNLEERKKERNKSRVYRSKKEESKRSYLSTQSLPSLRSTNPPLLYSDRPIYHHRHERKIEVERHREFQIPEHSSPLALYLCLLFLFFFIGFSHFSQTNRFGFTKRQNRGTHENYTVNKQWKTLFAQYLSTVCA